LNSYPLSQIVNITKDKLVGRGDILVDGFSTIENSSKTKITLILSKKVISNRNISEDAIILTNEDLASNFPKNCKIISDNPKLSFALISRLFQESSSLTNLMPITGTNVLIGKNPIIGFGTVLEDNVSIGNNVIIDHNVVIHRGVKIGNNVRIGAGSVIGSEGFGNVLRPDKKWEHISHLGSVIINNNVSIGSNCSIDRGTIDNTIIYSNVIIDNQVHIAHNVTIGEGTAIAAKVGIAGSCNIGKRNMIGGMVGIVDHINTADDVIISATSTVNKDLKEPGTYTGIMPISKHSEWKRIALWITKLDKILKFINLKISKL